MTNPVVFAADSSEEIGSVDSNSEEELETPVLSNLKEDESEDSIPEDSQNEGLENREDLEALASDVSTINSPTDIIDVMLCHTQKCEELLQKSNAPVRFNGRVPDLHVSHDNGTSLARKAEAIEQASLFPVDVRTLLSYARLPSAEPFLHDLKIAKGMSPTLVLFHELERHYFDIKKYYTYQKRKCLVYQRGLRRPRDEGTAFMTMDRRVVVLDCSRRMAVKISPGKYQQLPEGGVVVPIDLNLKDLENDLNFTALSAPLKQWEIFNNVFIKAALVPFRKDIEFYSTPVWNRNDLHSEACKQYDQLVSFKVDERFNHAIEVENIVSALLDHLESSGYMNSDKIEILRESNPEDLYATLRDLTPESFAPEATAIGSDFTPIGVSVRDDAEQELLQNKSYADVALLNEELPVRVDVDISNTNVQYGYAGEAQEVIGFPRSLPIDVAGLYYHRAPSELNHITNIITTSVEMGHVLWVRYEGSGGVRLGLHSARPNRMSENEGIQGHNKNGTTWMEHREATFSGSFWIPEPTRSCTPAIRCLIEDAKRILFGSMVYSGTNPSLLGTYRGRKIRLEFSSNTIKDFEGNLITVFPVVDGKDCSSPSLFFDYVDQTGVILPGVLRHLTKLDFGANCGINLTYENIIGNEFVKDVSSDEIAHLKMYYRKARWTDTELPLLSIHFKSDEEQQEDFPLPKDFCLDSPNFSSLVAFYESIAGSGVIQLKKPSARNVQEGASKKDSLKSSTASKSEEDSKESKQVAEISSAQPKNKVSSRKRAVESSFDPYGVRWAKASSQTNETFEPKLPGVTRLRRPCPYGGKVGGSWNQSSETTEESALPDDFPSLSKSGTITAKQAQINSKNRRWVGPFFGKVNPNQYPRLKKDYEFVLDLSILDPKNKKHRAMLDALHLDEEKRKKFLLPLKQEAKRLAPIKPWPGDLQHDVLEHLQI